MRLGATLQHFNLAGSGSETKSCGIVQANFLHCHQFAQSCPIGTDEIVRTALILIPNFNDEGLFEVAVAKSIHIHSKWPPGRIEVVLDGFTLIYNHPTTTLGALLELLIFLL